MGSALLPAIVASFLQVSDIHQIYYEEHGNKNGIPVVVLHGGPGWGCPPEFATFFDPEVYRIIMFDQRGARRSTPFGEMRENTTQDLIEDIEKLKNHLEIDRWVVFGGSWGSMLGLLYGEAYPESLLGFVLRGIFLGDPSQLLYGAKKFYPESWYECMQCIPEEEWDDLVSAGYTRMMDPDPKVHMPVASAFMKYDTIIATLLPNPELVEKTLRDEKFAFSVSRAFFHYAHHNFFIKQDQILNEIHRIAHLPCIIVHGRYDAITPVEEAWKVHTAWPGSKLWVIADAGHSSSEPSIKEALKQAMIEIQYGTNR